jgi:hypothetical protein
MNNNSEAFDNTLVNGLRLPLFSLPGFEFTNL